LVTLYAATILLSAALLFVVQPMFAKMILPRLGGTPAVWNTCVLFFQVVLLLGYLYVHVMTSSQLGLRAQVFLHVSLLLVTMSVLPITLDGAFPPQEADPVWWLLGMLAASVGLPFFAVTATAPLLQRWFSQSSLRDPYFLYAASNLGSLIGLLGYPLVIERILRLIEQSAMWLFGFVLLTVLIAACGVMALKHHRQFMRLGATRDLTAEPRDEPRSTDSWRQRLSWLFLAFVPSSLMLGVTTHISTDVAAVPLLWVMPLSLYLLTFIAAFANRPPISRVWTTRVVPFLIIASLSGLLVGQGSWWWLAIHLVTFAAVALVCHRELAERRPHAEHLTEFYLWISLGGALGGTFNAIVAPMVFTQIAEFPLVLALAAFARPSPAWRSDRLEPWPLVLGVPLAVFGAVFVAWSAGLAGQLAPSVLVTTFWVVAALALTFANRTYAFAAAVAIAAVAHVSLPPQHRDRVIFAERTFFGVHRVVEDTPPTTHRLMHGTTLHGWENLRSRDACAPTSYYHPTGPVGQVFSTYGSRFQAVAVLGLGAGGLVCYGWPGTEWTFYEIDPVVERVARDAALFSFLRTTKAEVNVVLGDGRLTLASAEPGAYDIIVIDVFSSDAIPMHLLTQEFVTIAFDRLRPTGILAFHISNRYLDLEPVIAAAMRGAGATALEQLHHPATDDAVRSRWLVAARQPAAIAALAADPRWREARYGDKSWTDDFSNIFDVLAWTPEAARGKSSRGPD